MKCQKGPPPERIDKTTVAARSPGDTWNVPPLPEAARTETESSSRAKRKTECCGPCRHRRRRHAEVAPAATGRGGTLLSAVRHSRTAASGLFCSGPHACISSNRYCNQPVMMCTYTCSTQRAHGSTTLSSIDEKMMLTWEAAANLSIAE